MPKKVTPGGMSDIKLSYLQKYITGETLLDVGTGYGQYSSWLKNQKPNLEITAIDIAPLGKKNDAVNFMLHDLEKKLVFQDNTFTSIIAFDIIEYITNEGQLIQELYRVCKPSGVLIGSVPHDDDSFLPEYNLTFYHRSDVTHKRYYTPDTLKKALEAKGFTVLTIELQGGINPQVIAEFFPACLQFFVKKCVGLLRRIRLINEKKLYSDIFFIAKKS